MIRGVVPQLVVLWGMLSRRFNGVHYKKGYLFARVF
ncbi:hypothetical protein CIP101434_00632 [Corynebacterium diphtheriae]|nr:hypothetical protein CIP101280_00342 [Corynebacterium diphtheriae]CAB0497248.1 hypothetical protein CIP101434_00632 [Corynebacterium diphtheriae]